MSLLLNCHLLGDDPDQMITVKVSMNDNISILKDLIKEKLPHLDRVAASKLVIWDCDLAPENLQKDLGGLVEKKPLSAFLKISQVFPGHVDDGHFNVIIRSPTGKPGKFTYNTVGRPWTSHLPDRRYRTGSKEAGEIS